MLPVILHLIICLELSQRAVCCVFAQICSLLEPVSSFFGGGVGSERFEVIRNGAFQFLALAAEQSCFGLLLFFDLAGPDASDWRLKYLVRGEKENYNNQLHPG